MTLNFTSLTSRFTFEHAPPAPSPKLQHFLALRTAQHVGDCQQRAVDHSAIIAGKLHQSSLGDQAADFDQLASTLAPVHDPGSCVGSRTGGLKPMPRRRRPARRECRRLQRL